MTIVSCNFHSRPKQTHPVMILSFFKLRLHYNYAPDMHALYRPDPACPDRLCFFLDQRHVFFFAESEPSNGGGRCIL